MIKSVLFDYGGVLNTFGVKGSTEEVIAEFFGIDVDGVNLDTIHDQLRRGLISTDEFFANLNKMHSSQTPMTEAIFLERTNDFLKRSEEVYALAAILRRNGIRTGILSNVYEISANKTRQLGNYNGFDPVILSYDVKMAKPDLEIYQLAIEKLGVKPEEIIFVDDQSKCWPPAEQLGMKVVRAVSSEQIVQDVKSIIRRENKILL